MGGLLDDMDEFRDVPWRVENRLPIIREPHASDQAAHNLAFKRRKVPKR